MKTKAITALLVGVVIIAFGSTTLFGEGITVLSKNASVESNDTPTSTSETPPDTSPPTQEQEQTIAPVEDGSSDKESESPTDTSIPPTQEKPISVGINDTGTGTEEDAHEREATEGLVRIPKPNGTVSTPQEIMEDVADICGERMNLSEDAPASSTKRFISYDDIGGTWHVTAISGSGDESKRLDVLVPDKIKELRRVVHIDHISLPDYSVMAGIPMINEFIKRYKNPGIDRWHNSRGELSVLMHDDEWENVKTVLIDMETGNEIKPEIINRSQAVNIAKNETTVKEFLEKHQKFNESMVYDEINTQWKITFYDSEIIVNVLIDAESGDFIDLNELNYKDVRGNFR